MRVLKWIVRYAFFALLLGGAVVWWLYCNATIATLQATVDSPEFIETATESISDAIAMMDRIEQFQDLRLIGIIGVAVVGFLLVLLVLWNIFGKRIAAWSKVKADGVITRIKTPRPAKPKAVAAPASAPAPTAQPAAEAPTAEAPAKKSYFCPYCGHEHAKRSAFCAGCGQKLPD